jgi:hypothetical protein
MTTARKTTIRILSEQPGNQMPLWLLSKALVKERALGFGVEPGDIVTALCNENKITYNRETDIVSLIGVRMTKILELEIERRALLHTVNQMSKGDARMETGLNDFLSSLEKKAAKLQIQISEEREAGIREIANRIWLEEGSPDGESLVHRHGKTMKLKEVHWDLATTEWTYGPDYLKSY